MKLRKEVCLLILGTYVLSGCGGGSMIPPSPNVSFSTTSLNFSDQAIDNTTNPQSVTLTNSGTATVSITNIVASASFAQTNTCGQPLVPGASCVINVTFTPSTTGSVGGMLSVTDNAPGSPQQVALSGAVAPGTLTGVCWGTEVVQSHCSAHGAPVSTCQVGEQAMTPKFDDGCAEGALVDISRQCSFNYGGGTVHGYCMVRL